MQPTVSQRTCVLEPIQCIRAIEACSSRQDAFGLHELEALSNFADASILFEEVIFLDTHVPAFRFTDEEQSADQRARAFLSTSKRWQFFNCRHHTSEYPGTDLVPKMGALRPSPEVKRIQVDRNVFKQHQIPHPVLGTEDWNVFVYLDKVNSAAACLGAPVIHGARGSRCTTLAVTNRHPGLAIDFIADYGQALRRRRADSRVANYRRTFHYAPFLLAMVLDQLDVSAPARVLEVIAQVREGNAKRYRELCREVVDAPARDVDQLERQIRLLLSQLAADDRLIPAQSGPLLKTLLSVIKPFAALAKDAATGVPVTTVSSIATALSADTSLSGSEFHRLSGLDIYGGLQIFNRLHKRRMDAREFFKHLRRVFGELDFTLEELERYLAREPVTDT